MYRCLFEVVRDVGKYRRGICPFPPRNVGIQKILQSTK
jgi:hypothetical protein